MSISIEVIGGDRVKAVLLRIEQGMDPYIREQLDSVADKVKADAKGFCPVDTGSLQASIRKEAVSSPAGNFWEVGVRAGGYIMNPKSGRLVDYAKYVEFGTSRARAQPFIRPALIANSEAIRAAVTQAVRDDVEEALSE